MMKAQFSLRPDRLDLPGCPRAGGGLCDRRILSRDAYGSQEPGGFGAMLQVLANVRLVNIAGCSLLHILRRFGAIRLQASAPMVNLAT